jgi:hypothetical protein
MKGDRVLVIKKGKHKGKEGTVMARNNSDTRTYQVKFDDGTALEWLARNDVMIEEEEDEEAKDSFDVGSAGRPKSASLSKSAGRGRGGRSGGRGKNGSTKAAPVKRGSTIARAVEYCKKEGYAVKSNKRMKKFAKRWLVLEEDSIRYYASKEVAERGKAPKGTIKLVPTARLQKQAEADAMKFQIALPDRTFMIILDSSAEVMQWLEAVKNNLVVLRQQSRLKEEQEAKASWGVFGDAGESSSFGNPMNG